MYVVAVVVYVEPESVAQFVAATRANARLSREEPGCVRFDVSQRVDEASQFLLYEVYRSADAFAAHQQTAHYLTWRETVADWMARPRQGTRLLSLDPTDAEWA